MLCHFNIPVSGIFEKSDLECLFHLMSFIILWRKVEPGKLLLWVFSSMPISNYCSILQTVYEILTNIYETFAVRLTDCSTVIESCDVYAVVARLQFYHKVQGPSSTGSLPLTQRPLVIVALLALYTHAFQNTKCISSSTITWRVWFLLLLLSQMDSNLQHNTFQTAKFFKLFNLCRSYHQPSWLLMAF